jgi:carbon monoxide dehydrogenase subunit G
MKLSNEFSVAAPLDQTWATLLDLERVASCLPGAKIEGGDGDGAFRGRFKVKIGAVTGDYTGIARIRELDEDRHVAVFDVQGKELRGQGTAAATITNQLIEHDGGTKVRVETELNISGRQAQFGRGLMADVAERILDDFAGRLEGEITSPNGATSRADPAPALEAGTKAEQPADEPEVLDLGGALWLPVAKRLLPAAGVAVAVGAVLLLAGRRRRRGITLHINL